MNMSSLILGREMWYKLTGLSEVLTASIIRAGDGTLIPDDGGSTHL
jgi:hypothetical protein